MLVQCIHTRVFRLMQVSLLGYWMFGYQPDFVKFLLCWVTFVLTFWTAESLGQLIAVITPTANTAVVAISLLIMPLISLSGFLSTGVPSYYKWIQHLSFMRCVVLRPNQRLQQTSHWYHYCGLSFACACKPMPIHGPMFTFCFIPSHQHCMNHMHFGNNHYCTTT